MPLLASLTKKNMGHREEPGDDVFVQSLLREQYRTLTQLAPAAYCVALIAGIGLIAAFRGSAPDWILKTAPPALICIILLRLKYWISARGRVDTTPVNIMLRDIKRTTIIGAFQTLAFSLLSINLMGYASHTQQALAVVAVWICGLTCAFCLYILPRTAIAILLSASIPLGIHFVSYGEGTLFVLANLIFMTSGMAVYVLSKSFGSFKELVQSRTIITRKHLEAERAMKEARLMANTDPLTGLANRRHFEMMLHSHMDAMSASHGTFTVAMLDLDGFKPINDAFGHTAGDRILQQVADRLSDSMQDRGELARMGGDEFAIIARDVSTPAQIRQFAASLKQAFAKPFLVNATTARLDCTIGFSIAEDDKEDPVRLLVRADMALYKAKRQERGSIGIFDVEDEARAKERGVIEQALREALAKHGLHLHYQPIISLRTGETTGFEALARWNHPTLGAISPAVFIPIAEQIGIIEPLTEMLLRKAARFAANWPESLTLSFNLSAEHLVKPAAALRIISILSQTGLMPHRFIAEVTESAIMHDIESARHTLDLLRQAGAHVALDDFGTGYSSLSHIADLPLDRIKIDKSFTQKVCDSERIASLLRSIIDICAHLGLECVAEGIETDMQMASLRQDDCGFGQGYLIAKPMPAGDVMRYLGAQSAAA